MASTSIELAASFEALKGRQVRLREPIYEDALQFLIEEAHLLDEGLFDEWFQMLSEDFQSVTPVRTSQHRHSGAGFNASMVWSREDSGSLAFKIKRLNSDSAFNEDPPSRTRRMVTNLRLFETATPEEYVAQTYFLLRRNRGDAHETESLSGRRDDLLRCVEGEWRFARRVVWMDQTVLGMQNMAVFL